MDSFYQIYYPLLNSLKDTAILLNPDGEILFCNHSGQCKFDSLNGGVVKYSDFISEDAIDEYSMYFGLSKQGVNGFLFAQRFNGERYLDVEISLSRIVSGTNDCILVIEKDLSNIKRAERIQNALFKISESVNTTENIDTLYKKIHEIVATLMPVNNFYIALYDEDSDLISFPYYIDEFDEAPGPVKPGKGLTEYVINTGTDMLVDEALDAEMRQKGLIDLVGEPSKIWLGVALKMMDKTIGVIVVQDYNNPLTYGEEEKQVLVFVSEQIASAINKKYSDEKLQSSLEELKIHQTLLEQRASELEDVNSQLNTTSLKLEKMNADKDKFFSIISHDLKGSFTALLGLSEFLSTEIEEFSPEEIVNITHSIYKSARSVYGLLENLLVWSRIQTGRIQFIPSNFSINELIFEINEILGLNAKQKNILLATKAEPDLYVYADKEMINTALRNIVANAIKFTHEGGKILIAAKVEDNKVVIKVRDNGVGISEKNIEKLFRIDVSMSTVGTNKEKGSGLGLILCKEFIEKNGGDISVKSDEGKGTTFTFTIPLGEKPEFNLDFMFED